MMEAKPAGDADVTFREDLGQRVELMRDASLQ
jgi:hypothetical protein